jgi:ankyrin repeat protein
MNIEQQYRNFEDAVYNKNNKMAMDLITPEFAEYINKSNGETPLILACNYKMSKHAFALIATGRSNPGHVAKNKFTALMHACASKMSEVALALIATGESNPGIFSNMRQTALLYACQYKLSNVALALIATGHSNPGIITEYGTTALMNACDNRMSDVVMALLATGDAKPELVTNASEKRFLKPILNEMKMTAFITASRQANAAFTAENIMEMYDYVTAETQNAGKGTTIKGTFIKGKTRRLYKSRKHKPQ